MLLSNAGTPWTTAPPLGALVIDGVNHLLDGVDTTQDFWPIGPFVETEAGANHVVTTATPEPGTCAFFLLGAALFVLRRHRNSSVP